MNQGLNLQRLRELLSCLEHLRSIRFSVYLPQDVWKKEEQQSVPFCRMIGETEDGEERCEACWRQALEEVWEKNVVSQTLCHAGCVIEAIPVGGNGRAEAVVMFAFLPDGAPVQEQWQRVAENAAWVRDQKKLQTAFSLLPRLSEREIDACCRLVRACACESGEKMASGAKQSDVQRLQKYIDEHYTQHLTLDSIGRALEISKSRLCAIAAASGTTVGRLLTEKRIEEAKNLLISSDAPIRQVAERVGIADYNYFTKVFRKAVGATPRDFRNSGNRRKETLDNLLEI